MQARDTATLGLVANVLGSVGKDAVCAPDCRSCGRCVRSWSPVAAVTRSRLLVVASLVLPLAACAVGPDFVSPTAPLADNFTGANSHSIKTDHQDYRDWWSAFHDPTLNRLVQIAYNQNLTLLSAGTRVLQARAVLGIAVGEFYPQVQQGAGNLMYNRTSAATPLAAPNSTPKFFWTNSLAVQAAWELDFWGKFRRGIESADAAYLASIANYDQVLVTLLGDVAVTYIGIRTTEQLIAIARDNVRKEEDSLKIARAKYQGGSTSELDVYQATTVLEATASAIPQLEIQLEQGRNALCVLLGIPPQSLGRLLARSRGIPTPPYTIAVGIPADLLRRRPDIAAAELAALAQSAQIGIAESQLYPAISISGTFGGTASTTNGSQSWRDFQIHRRCLCGRSGLPMEHLELRPDHQQCSSAGRHAAAAIGRLPERRTCGAAASGRRDFHFPFIAITGGGFAPERCCRKWDAASRNGAIRRRRDGFHDCARGGAKSIPGRERSRCGARQCVTWCDRDISCAWRRVADSRG